MNDKDNKDRTARDDKSQYHSNTPKTNLKPLKSSPKNTIYIPYIPDMGDNSIDNPSRADTVFIEDIIFNIPPYAYCQPLEHHWHKNVTLELHDHYDNNRTPIERDCDERCVSYMAAEPDDEQVCICGIKFWARNTLNRQLSHSHYILN